jgi:negative regulator of flagellin synthesis FlgM
MRSQTEGHMKQVDLNAASTAQTSNTNRAENARQGRVSSTKPFSAEQRVDQVEVSSTGKEISKLVERAKQLPEIRQERVEQLRELVQSGKYDVSSKQIADAILRDEK